MTNLLETMKEVKKYRFSLVRYVPDKLRGEYINVGVIIYLPEDDQISFRLIEDYSRLRCFDPYFSKSDLDGFRKTIEKRLNTPFAIDRFSVEQRHLPFPANGLVTKRSPNFLELLQLTLSGKFQLTAPDNGVAVSSDELLTQLYEVFAQPASERLADQNQLLKLKSASYQRKVLQRRVRAALKQEGLLGSLFKENVIVPGTDEKHGFSFGSLNGTANLIQVESLSYKTARQKQKVAESLIGKIDLVWKKSKYGPERTQYQVLIETPIQNSDLDFAATQDALRLLQGYEGITTVINPTEPVIENMVRQLLYKFHR